MGTFFSLDGQVAVVTGGASGIGLQTVKRFLQAGAKVVMADMHDASALAEELGATFVQTNVTDEKQVRNALQTALENYGRLDILVNNAGVFADYKSIAESETKQFEFCMNVNVYGVFYGIKQATELMNDGGSIINTSSAAGLVGAIKLSSYAASKHAVIGLSKTAALELAHKKIRVNCICPTTVNTPMAHTEGGEHLLEAEKVANPLGRICEPGEAAALIHFLAARDCGFINGQAISLDGGASAGTTERAFEKLMV
jgi:3alpha(or 20beta)-hydroxysteroid dehydrogenase